MANTPTEIKFPRPINWDEAEKHRDAQNICAIADDGQKREYTFIGLQLVTKKNGEESPIIVMKDLATTHVVKRWVPNKFLYTLISAGKSEQGLTNGDKISILRQGNEIILDRL